MVSSPRPAGSPARSHHVGEKKPPVKRATSHRLDKETQKKKTRVRSVKPKGK